MSKRKTTLKSLNSEIKIYDNFLRGAAAISGLISDVERRKREAEARRMFFQYMPESVIEEFGDKLYEDQKHNEEQARLHVPNLPAINHQSIRILSTGTASSSDYLEITQTYRHLAAVDTSQSWVPQVQVEPIKVDMVNDAFVKLADERARSKTLPPRLNRINEHLAKEFRVAQQSYDKAMSGIIGVDQSAMQLRDVIEQLWGGLVVLIKRVNPRKYGKSELKLNTTGKSIAVECLAADEIRKKQLTDLLEKASKIHHDISNPAFGKNPLSNDKVKLTEIFELWQLVVSGIADYVYLNIRIRAGRIIVKKADT